MVVACSASRAYDAFMPEQAGNAGCSIVAADLVGILVQPSSVELGRHPLSMPSCWKAQRHHMRMEIMNAKEGCQDSKKVS